MPGRVVRSVRILKPRILGGGSTQAFRRAVSGSRVTGVGRRGKYLRFSLEGAAGGGCQLLAHLGMTGRMFLAPAEEATSRHTAAVLDLGDARWVFEDVRGFGRLTLDAGVLDALGPEPLEEGFTLGVFQAVLARSSRAVKVQLLDQRVVAGVGNIYACEALFRAGVAPLRPSRSLTPVEARRLRDAVQAVLRDAIALGCSVPLDFSGAAPGSGNRLFYYGAQAGMGDFAAERFLVYDRAGQPCRSCGTRIRRVLLSGRGTFDCPNCQR